jgi:hypothetical protein
VAADLWPRDADSRFKLYCKDEHGQPQCIASAPDAQGIGLAMVTILTENAEHGDAPPIVGLLDAGRGRWLSGLWVRQDVFAV